MNKDDYLRRIGIEQTVLATNLENLRLLQKTHLLTVPFENLDIHWKRPIVLDTNKFYQKIIEEKRGGFCYELNGLFNELLNEIGFQTKIISARVCNDEGQYGPEYDHLAILAKVGDEDFLVDVGFGDFAAEPLRFVLGVEQSDENGTFLIRKRTGEYFEVVKKVGENWKSEFMFQNLARTLSEFTEMCNFHQSSPESHFMKRKGCSVMLENGRKTLVDNKFILTLDGVKTESELNSKAEFDEILECEFGIKKN